jgi:hypothetical protein
MDAKEAALTARKYFEETKTTRFFDFSAPTAEKTDGRWKIVCEIRELFQPDIQKFEITIDDEDGAILDVKRID